MLEGRHLETFVSTTPKPLLTVVYGTLYALTHDWRALDWSTVLALAAGVSLAAGLARRIGGLGAWAFAAVVLAGAPVLLFDASLALATPWALLAWATAGWAVTGPRPRYGLAGLALALGALARVETLVLIATVLAALLLVRFGPRQVRRPIPRRAWLLALGLLAVPIAMLHDWRLTGDPLFWTTVAQRYSEANSAAVLSVGSVAGVIVRRYLAESVLVILAVLGWGRLASRGHWGLAIGLLGLGPGILAFLMALAARHIFVSDRYFAGPDIAVGMAAAIGFGTVSVEVPTAVRRWWAGTGKPTAWGPPVAATVLAMLLTAGWAGIGTNLWQQMHAFTRAAVATRTALPALRDALHAQAANSGGTPSGPTSLDTRILVPVPLWPVLAVDLDLPLTQVGSDNPAAVDLAAGRPSVGQLVLHVADAEKTSPGLDQLHVTKPTLIDGVTVVPVSEDARRGYWLVRIDAAATP